MEIEKGDRIYDPIWDAVGKVIEAEDGDVTVIWPSHGEETDSEAEILDSELEHRSTP